VPAIAALLREDWHDHLTREGLAPAARDESACPACGSTAELTDGGECPDCGLQLA
jgi:hypothetical protein